MGNIINRYLAREIIIPFFLGLAIFTFILLADRIINLTELVVSKGAGIIEVLSLISYILPSFMVIAIPMSFLLAVLLAFGRLSTDEEITAAKSSGLSLVQMMPPVIILSIGAFIICLFLMIYALPWGNHSFKSKIYNIVKKKADTSIVPGRVIDSFPDMIIYVNEEDKSSGRYKGVLLSENRKGIKSDTITAREGELISSPDELSIILRLYDGSIHREGEKKDMRYSIIDFKTYDLKLSLGTKDGGTRAAPKGDRELSLSELIKKADELESEGRDSNYLLVELHKKFSIPFACIVFAFIGAPLGIQGKRSGKAYGFIVSLIIITVYWLFLLWGEVLGDKGSLPPFISMWAPNIFFLIIGLHILNKANRDSEIKALSIFGRIYSFITSIIRKVYRYER